MMTLFLNTGDYKKISVGLKINEREYIKTQRIRSNRSQIILPMIDVLLKKHKLKLKDIDEIEINSGPGSFTGLRVGIAIANVLSLSLKIPVNGKKIR